MPRPSRSLGVLGTLVVASLAAAGCGQSVEDATAALCADITTLRADVRALGELNQDSSYEEFSAVRTNLRATMRSAEASADNVGEDDFDAVEDAWEDLDEELDDIESASDLRTDFDDLRAAFDTFVAEADEARDAVDCSSNDEAGA